MSIPDIVQNINSRQDPGSHLKGERRGLYIMGLAGILSLISSVFLGYIWQKINFPSPIIIECSDEVTASLTATSSPIPSLSKVNFSKKTLKETQNRSNLATSTSKTKKKKSLKKAKKDG